MAVAQTDRLPEDAEEHQNERHDANAADEVDGVLQVEPTGSLELLAVELGLTYVTGTVWAPASFFRHRYLAERAGFTNCL